MSEGQSLEPTLATSISIEQTSGIIQIISSCPRAPRRWGKTGQHSQCHNREKKEKGRKDEIGGNAQQVRR